MDGQTLPGRILSREVYKLSPGILWLRFSDFIFGRTPAVGPKAAHEDYIGDVLGVLLAAAANDVLFYVGDVELSHSEEHENLHIFEGALSDQALRNQVGSRIFNHDQEFIR